MFSFSRPTDETIRHQLGQARHLPLNYGMAAVTERERAHLPTGYVRDHLRTEIGHGKVAFSAAKAAFRRWQQFDLGWVRVANPEANPLAEPEAEQLVAVEAHTFGLWSVNISRILYTIDEDDRFGFAYGTTQHHVESGEERFLLEFYPVSGIVFYDLLAISRPAHWLARLAYPFTRNQQKRFARESHRRMQQVVTESLA